MNVFQNSSTAEQADHCNQPKFRLIDILCLCLCTAGILLFALSLKFQPGHYHGYLNGSFSIVDMPYAYFIIKLDAETESQWAWAEPKNFTYKTIYMKIISSVNSQDGYSQTAIFFPSAECLRQENREPFTFDLLMDLLNATPETRQQQAFREDVNKIYELILCAGNGTAPAPRHHSYQLSPLGNVIHFAIGNSYLPLVAMFLAALAIMILATTRLLPRRSCSSGHRQLAPKISILPILVTANFIIFIIGMLLNMFGGWIDGTGAYLCQVSTILGLCLVPVSVMRFVVCADVFTTCLSSLFAMIYLFLIFGRLLW